MLDNGAKIPPKRRSVFSFIFIVNSFKVKYSLIFELKNEVGKANLNADKRILKCLPFLHWVSIEGTHITGVAVERANCKDCTIKRHISCVVSWRNSLLLVMVI